MPANSTETPATEPIPLAASKDGSVQWNLAGNPLATPLALGDLRLTTNAPSCNDGSCGLDKAKDNNLVHNKVWFYDGSGYVEKDTNAQLDAWDGFWIAALGGSKDYSLTLGAKGNASGGAIGARPVQSTPLNKGTLFASVGGNGDCKSKESPCNIFTAFSKLEPGSVLFIRGGTYSIVDNQLSPGQSGTKENPIIIESYPGETAILEGAFKSQEDVKNSTRTKAIRLAEKHEYISIRKIEIKSMGWEAIGIFGSHNTVEGCHLHHNMFPGVGINGGEWKATSSFYIPYTRGDNTVKDNVIHDNSDSWFPTNGGNADGIGILSGKNNRVIHNTVYSNSDDGIDTWRSNKSEVSYNLVYDNGKASGDGNGIKAGGNAEVAYDENKLLNGREALVEYNISFKNKRRGFDFNSGKKVTFQYNTSWKNGMHGFTSENGTIVKNNIAYENGELIELKAKHIGNSWQKEGAVAFISTDQNSPDFLKPTAGGGFEDIGAYAMGANTDAIIFLIGDSTVHNPKDATYNPTGEEEKGWGSKLGEYMKNSNNVKNRARSGASSKSYLKNAGYQRNWEETMQRMGQADISHGAYLFIQFGHNDEKTWLDHDFEAHTKPGRDGSFYNHLNDYTQEAQDLGFTPVLITSVERMYPHNHSHGEYPQTVRDLAADKNILLLDLQDKSFNEFSKYNSSEEITNKFAYDDGTDDHTHFNPEGASIVAGWVKELICGSRDKPLCSQFK
jgi:parallel beta-helix repeat protein